MEFQDWMYDKRVVRRNIRKGLISREEYEKYLEALPDMSDNVVIDSDEAFQGSQEADAVNGSTDEESGGQA